MTADAPFGTDLCDLPCYQLYLGWRRAQRFYGAALGELKPQRMYLLEHLAHAGDTPVCQLGELLGVDPGTVSGLLSRMERDGQAERVRHPGDRLQVFVRITDHGRSLHARAAARVVELDRELASRFTPRDLQGLRRVVAAFEHPPEPDTP